MDPLVRLIVGTLMISGAWFGVRRYARRRATEGRKQLQVLARLGLAKGVSVAVVRIADRGLVLGVSDKGVSLVAELGSQDLEDVAAAPAGAAPEPRAAPAPPGGPPIGHGPVPRVQKLRRPPDGSCAAS